MRHSIGLGLCVLGLLAPLSGSAQSPAPAKTTYLVVYRPGPAWIAGKPVTEQPLREHGRYMLSLYVKGSLKFAGPFTDDAGGAVVLEVADEAEVQALVAADPAVKDRVFVSEVHPWRLVNWDQYVKK